MPSSAFAQEEHAVTFQQHEDLVGFVVALHGVDVLGQVVLAVAQQGDAPRAKVDDGLIARARVLANFQQGFRD